jgi:DnaJ-class molecular chaperone
MSVHDSRRRTFDCRIWDCCQNRTRLPRWLRPRGGGALGCEIVVPTLEGKEKIKVESGSQPNTIIKLRGKGVTHINSRGKGDQYIRIVVNIPKKLNKHQKNILDEFQKTND